MKQEKEYWVTDYIKNYDSVVLENICDDVLNEQFSYEASAYSTHDSGKVIKTDRVTSEDFWIRKDHKFYQSLHKSYGESIKRYREEFPDFTVQHLTDFRVSKYNTGGFMSNHVDLIHHSHGQQWGYPQVTVLLFMNDDYQGGEIIIAGRKFKPNKGSCIVFPSNFAYPHEVLEVIKGTRYSITCWLM